MCQSKAPGKKRFAPLLLVIAILQNNKGIFVAVVAKRGTWVIQQITKASRDANGFLGFLVMVGE